MTSADLHVTSADLHVTSALIADEDSPPGAMPLIGITCEVAALLLAIYCFTYCLLLTTHLLRRRFTNYELHTTTKVAQQLGGGGGGINGSNGSAAPVWVQVSQGVHSLNCALDEQREKPMGADEVSE